MVKGKNKEKKKKGIVGGIVSRCVQCNHWVFIREKGRQESQRKRCDVGRRQKHDLLALLKERDHQAS